MKSEQCIQTHDQIVLYQHGNRDTSAGILTIVPLPIDRDLFHRLPRRRQPANKILNRYHLPSEDEYLLSVTVTAASEAFVNKEKDIAQSVESKKAKQAIKAPPPIRSWQARLSRQPPTLPRVSSIVALTSNKARPTSHRSSCLHHQLYNILRSPSIPSLVSQSIRTSL